MSVQKVKIGLIGCGNISGIYLETMRAFDHIEVAACADLDPARAEAATRTHGIGRACAPGELLADPEIEMVLNLTVPKAHAEVTLAALAAGKHVYTEKPLGITRSDGMRIMAAARSSKRLVGAAPGTFLGAGLQTCRAALDNGEIGEPIAAAAFMTCRGHESWHPDPAFYYQAGGGPLLDMGPYYLTALISLLGPVQRVTGSARASFPVRTITSQPKYGQTIKVEVPTHVAGVLDFANGTVATIVTSFDIHAARLPRMEIYGTDGSLGIPDPNTFGGPVLLYRPGQDAWTEIPLLGGYTENSRGIGVADMAYALRAGRKPRASGENAYHVLDVMLAIVEASTTGRHVAIQGTCMRPPPLPTRLQPGDWAQD